MYINIRECTHNYSTDGMLLVPVSRVMLLKVSLREKKCMRKDKILLFFSISNRVRQGGTLSPKLFSLYMDDLSKLLVNSGFSCFIVTFTSSLNNNGTLRQMEMTSARSNNLIGLFHSCNRDIQIELVGRFCDSFRSSIMLENCPKKSSFSKIRVHTTIYIENNKCLTSQKCQPNVCEQ